MRRARLPASVAGAIIIPLLLLAGSVMLTRIHGLAAPHPVPRTEVTSQPGRRARFLLGVYERGTPASWQPIGDFARTVGQTPQLVLLYIGVGVRFSLGFAEGAHSRGAAPVIQINPGRIPLRSIADGTYDGWLRGYAHQVARFAQPVVIGFAHEMNGSWYPWGYRHQSPAEFVAAWRHIVQVFRQAGATNVTWLWTISASGNRALLPADWPGPQYVNWVGIDGYYNKPSSQFGHLFAPVITAVRSITRDPILVSETGVAQGAAQTSQIRNLFAGIEHDRLLGLVWLDVNQRQVAPFHDNWRLEGDPSAVAAFRAEMAALRG